MDPSLEPVTIKSSIIKGEPTIASSVLKSHFFLPESMSKAYKLPSSEGAKTIPLE